MKIDEMTFFHEGTLQICGSLQLKEILTNCLHFLKRYMPISGILLDYYDPKINALRNIGIESDLAIKQLSEPIRLSPKEELMILNRDPSEKSDLVNEPNDHPLSNRFRKALGLEQGSYIALRLRVKESRLGAVIVFAKGFNRFTEEHQHLLELLHDPFALAMSNIHHYQELNQLKENLKDDNQYLYHELHSLSGSEIIGENSGLKEIMNMVRQVAQLDSRVLLLGETGVGKEVIANSIHYNSTRKNGPLIKVNCGAIPESLIDSELFGHEKGAFTGALTRKRGRFERAHQGTIFLDEIGELQPSAQVKLLRVIQDQQIERLGGTEPVPVDVRIIAATHRNLEEMVKAGDFREDLWFRLNVFPITIPPLRQRKEDIPELVEYFIERKAREMKLRQPLKPDGFAIERLKQYQWPGNVRELENAVEREIIRSRSQASEKSLLFIDFSPTGSPIKPIVHEPTPSIDEPLDLDLVIRQHIEKVLNLTKGKIQGEDGAAAKLGVHPSTLRHRLRKLGIPFGQVRAFDETV